MERLWLHEAWVRCIHPGWDLLVGWEAVRESWEQIFAGTRWIRVTPTSVQIQVLGDVGLVGCAENITATSDGDVGVAVAQATNLFSGRRVAHVPPPLVARARARDPAVQRDRSVARRGKRTPGASLPLGSRASLVRRIASMPSSP